MVLTEYELWKVGVFLDPIYENYFLASWAVTCRTVERVGILLRFVGLGFFCSELLLIMDLFSLEISRSDYLVEVVSSSLK